MFHIFLYEIFWNIRSDLPLSNYSFPFLYCVPWTNFGRLSKITRSSTNLDSHCWQWNSKDGVYWHPRKLTDSSQVWGVHLWKHSLRASSTPLRERESWVEHLWLFLSTLFINPSVFPSFCYSLILYSCWVVADDCAAVMVSPVLWWRQFRAQPASDDRLTSILHNRTDFYLFLLRTLQNFSFK